MYYLWKKDAEDDTATQTPWKEDVEDDTTAKPPSKHMHLGRRRTPLHIKVADNFEQIVCGELEDDVAEKKKHKLNPFLKT